MSDDDIQDIASEFSVWTEQGWAVVDKVAFAREIERRSLERAADICDYIERGKYCAEAIRALIEKK